MEGAGNYCPYTLPPGSPCLYTPVSPRSYPGNLSLNLSRQNLVSSSDVYMVSMNERSVFANASNDIGQGGYPVSLEYFQYPDGRDLSG